MTYNFSAGPAVLPAPVLRQAAEELPDWHGTGMSVMEMSHRGRDFVQIAESAEASLRDLMAIPDDYRVLFLQGGATGQFAAIPMNLAQQDGAADYVITGMWGKRADMIVHETDPYNAEPPRAALAGRMLTPVEAFYVPGDPAPPRPRSGPGSA